MNVVHYLFMKYFTKHTLHTLFGFTGFLAALIGFMALTSPYKLPLPLLIIPSVLLSGSVYFGLRTAQLLIMSRKTKLFAVALSLYVLLLSLLASLQQLSWKDVVFAGLLLWLFVFYYKRTKK